MKLSLLDHFQKNHFVKTFIADNPQLIKKYVYFGVNTVGLALSSLNIYVKHLLTVQGLDPNATPGTKEREDLFKALENSFTKTHEKDLDSEYDFSWVQKKFEETRKGLNQLQLTKEKFIDCTDLSKCDDVVHINAPFILTDDVSTSSEVDKKEDAVTFEQAKSLVDEMIECELLPNSPDAIKNQLDLIMKMNHNVFASMKKIVRGHLNLSDDDKFVGFFKRTKK